jgi:type IV pilus assembly protein PilY1
VRLGSGAYTVLLTSGYNSTPTARAGCGCSTRPPAPSSTSSPSPTARWRLESGLAHVSPFVEADGSVRYVFGGDLLGNVWKFDLVAKTAPARWRC